MALGAGAVQVGPAIWVFLACPCFAAKPPPMRVGFIWISLDSLVRIETFQWVTREFHHKNFSLAFPHGSPRAIESRRSLRGGRAKRFHEASYRVSDFLQSIAAAGRPGDAPCSCRCLGGEKARFSFRRHRGEPGDGVHIPGGPIVRSRDAQLGAADPVRILDKDLARA